jgi:hypothetical protein
MFTLTHGWRYHKRPLNTFYDPLSGLFAVYRINAASPNNAGNAVAPSIARVKDSAREGRWNYGNNTDHFIPYPVHSGVRHDWALRERELIRSPSASMPLGAAAVLASCVWPTYSRRDGPKADIKERTGSCPSLARPSNLLAFSGNLLGGALDAVLDCIRCRFCCAHSECVFPEPNSLMSFWDGIQPSSSGAVLPAKLERVKAAKPRPKSFSTMRSACMWRIIPFVSYRVPGHQIAFRR